MGLNMSDVTYGRNETGKEKLKTDLLSDIQRAERALTGDEFNTFIRIVQQNWSGPDADNFIRQFRMSIEEVQTAFKKFNKQITNALDSDSRNFAKMQNTNIHLANGAIKKIQ